MKRNRRDIDLRAVKKKINLFFPLIPYHISENVASAMSKIKRKDKLELWTFK